MSERQFFRPLRAFAATEAAGGMLTLAGAGVALVWANISHSTYSSFWSTETSISIGHHVLQLDLKHVVNEGLMAIFFLVVGLEIKRELVLGELRVLRRAALPVAAAVGGMLVPAALFALITRGSSAGHGWGVPMATDIALALGVIALVGRKIVPASLSLFLLAVAIVDDIGAIVVIAVFYSGGIAVSWLLVAAAIVAAAIVLRRLRVSSTLIFVVTGAGLWLALHNAGVHATIAGVVMGLLAPTTSKLAPHEIDHGELLDLSSPEAATVTATLARHSVSVVERLEYALHPLTSFAIVPIFAVANAGIRFDTDLFDGLAGSRVFWGIVIGLVVGKPLGITAAAWLAVRCGAAELPTGVRFGQVAAIGAVAGIGFTVSVFVSELAFFDDGVLGHAKVGVLAASLLAGAIGVVALRSTR